MVEKNQQLFNLTTGRDNLQNQVNQLTNQVNDLNQQLNVANVLITNTQNRLGINNLNNLPQLPDGETLASLLARPTPNQLREKQADIDELKGQKDALQQEINTRPTQDQLEQSIRERNNIQSQRDSRPNITLDQWNNDYSRRPTQQQFNNMQQELNNQISSLNRQLTSARSQSTNSPSQSQPTSSQSSVNSPQVKKKENVYVPKGHRLRGMRLKGAK